ncbi:MAG: acyloxyacyl hydrolase [Bacteroidia bacterium]|nr:acyloxyacyl hydrolase [Bacteroidia bacterium]
MIKTVFVLLSLIFPLFLSAQTQYYCFFQQGKTLRIHPRYPEMDFAAKGLEAGIFRYGNGKAPWHTVFKNAGAGIAFSYWNPGSPQVLGKIYSVTPCFGQILLRKSRWKWDYETGFSLAWFSKPYNRTTNPGNIAVGSHVSSISFLRTKIRYSVFPSVALSLGAGITHSSNGSTTSPNLGVNIPSFLVGVSYEIPGKKSPELTKNPLPDWKNEYFYGIRTGIGITENLVPDGPKYPVFTTNVFWGKEASPWFSWRTGAEVFYSQKSREAILEGELIPKGLNHRSTGVVIYGGGEITAGHISLLAQAGPYLINPFLMEKYRIYTKFGFQFYPFDKQLKKDKQLYMGVYVHAHSGEADFAETGIGYLF